MKRYLKLISLVTIIFLAIGTFYIQESLANKKHPEFFIKAKTGDVKEIETLSLSATLNNNYALSIDQNGSIYERPLSYLDALQLDDKYTTKEVKKLIKEQRNFMRGKNRSPVLYFDDEQTLAYVDINVDFKYDAGWINDYTFEISVLNKDTNKKTTTDIKIPNTNDYESIWVQGVQVIDDNLKIVTANDTRDDTINYQTFTHIHVYTVSLDTMTITDEKKLGIDKELSHNERFDTKSIFNGDDIGKKEHIGFISEQFKIQPGNDGYNQVETVERKFLIYNFKTGEQTILELSDEYEHSYNAEYMNENILYLSQRTDDAFEVVTYDIVEQEVKTEQVFDLPVELASNGLNIKMDKDKVYIYSYYSPPNLDAILFIGDVTTGDILFEGTIEPVKEDQLEKDYELAIYSLTFD